MSSVKSAFFDERIAVSTGLNAVYSRERVSIADGQASVPAFTPEYADARVIFGAPVITDAIAATGSVIYPLCSGRHPVTGVPFTFVYNAADGNLRLYTGSDWATFTAIDVTPTGGSPSKTGQIDMLAGTPDADANYCYYPVSAHAVSGPDDPCVGAVIVQCKVMDYSSGWRTVGTAWLYWDYASGATNKFRRLWPTAAPVITHQVIATPGRDRGGPWCGQTHFNWTGNANAAYIFGNDYVAQQSSVSDGGQLVLIEAVPNGSGNFTYRSQYIAAITGAPSWHFHGGGLIEDDEGKPGLVLLIGDGVANSQLGVIFDTNDGVGDGMSSFFSGTPDTPLFAGGVGVVGSSVGVLQWSSVAGNGTTKAGMQPFGALPTDTPHALVVGADETTGHVFRMNFDPSVVASTPTADHLIGNVTSQGRTHLCFAGRKNEIGGFWHLTPGTSRANPNDSNMNAVAGGGFAWSGRILHSPYADLSVWGVLCRSGTSSAAGLYWVPLAWDTPTLVLGAPSAALGMRTVPIPPYRKTRALKLGAGGGINYATVRTGTGNTGLLGAVTGTSPTGRDAFTLAPVVGGNVTLIAISYTSITGTFSNGETVTESTSGATGRFRTLKNVGGNPCVLLAVMSGTFTGGQTLTGGTSGATTTGGSVTVQRVMPALPCPGNQWIVDCNGSTERIVVTGGAGTFTTGETVTESVSGATGVFKYMQTEGATTYMYLTAASGTLTGGQTLTGGTSGATRTGGTRTVVGNNFLGFRRIACTSGGTVTGIVPGGEFKLGIMLASADPTCRLQLRLSARPAGADSGTSINFDPVPADHHGPFVTWLHHNNQTGVATPWTNPSGFELSMTQGATGVADQTFLMGCAGLFAGASTSDMSSRPMMDLDSATANPEATFLLAGFAPSANWAFGYAALIPEDGPDRETFARPARYLFTLKQDALNYIRVSIDRINFTNATWTATGRVLSDSEFGATAPPTGAGYSHPGSGWEAVVRARGPATGISAGTTKEARIASASGNNLTLDASTASNFATDGATNVNGSIIGHDRIKVEFCVAGTTTTRYLQGANYNTFDFARCAPVLVAIRCANGTYTVSASVNGSTAFNFSYSGTLARPTQFLTGDQNGANVEAQDLAFASMDENDSGSYTADQWVQMARSDWANPPVASSGSVEISNGGPGMR